MPIFTWSSLGRGFFSGRVRRYDFAETRAVLEASTVKAYCCEDNFRRLDRAAALARAKGLTIPQIAMAYLLAQPLNVFPIVGAANREELESNLGALQCRLTRPEAEWLDLRRTSRLSPLALRACRRRWR